MRSAGFLDDQHKEITTKTCFAAFAIESNWKGPQSVVEPGDTGTSRETRAVVGLWESSCRRSNFPAIFPAKCNSFSQTSGNFQWDFPSGVAPWDGSNFWAVYPFLAVQNGMNIGRA